MPSNGSRRATPARLLKDDAVVTLPEPTFSRLHYSCPSTPNFTVCATQLSTALRSLRISDSSTPRTSPTLSLALNLAPPPCASRYSWLCFGRTNSLTNPLRGLIASVKQCISRDLRDYGAVCWLLPFFRSCCNYCWRLYLHQWSTAIAGLVRYVLDILPHDQC